METLRLKALLDDAIERYMKQPFEWFTSLGDEHSFDEIGTPSDSMESGYCQIEVEVLDRFVENGVQVLHVPVTARDERKQLEAHLFFYADGRVRWDKTIYELRDGIPHPINQRD